MMARMPIDSNSFAKSLRASPTNTSGKKSRFPMMTPSVAVCAATSGASVGARVDIAPRLTGNQLPRAPQSTAAQQALYRSATGARVRVCVIVLRSDAGGRDQLDRPGQADRCGFVVD